MSERFTSKEDGIHDKETDRIFKLNNNLTNLLNTLDKMNKCHLIRIHAQDEYIQKLETQISQLKGKNDKFIKEWGKNQDATKV